MHTEPYEMLAAAICKQAAEDFRAARDTIGVARLRDDEERIQVGLDRAEECRRFFRGNACMILANADGKYILAELEKEWKEPRRYDLFSSMAQAKEKYATFRRVCDEENARRVADTENRPKKLRPLSFDKWLKAEPDHHFVDPDPLGFDPTSRKCRA